MITATSALAVAVYNRHSTLPVPDYGGGGPVLVSDRILTGKVVNQSGLPVAEIEVGMADGMSCTTDQEGTFMLKDVPAGMHRLSLRPQATRSGQADQFIQIQPSGTTVANLVYNLEKSRVGLLSVTFPVSHGEWPVEFSKGSFRAEVHGRCDGLASQFRNMAIWPVIHSSSDGNYWIQSKANVDPTTNTWDADVYVGESSGDADKRPQAGEKWTIQAIVAEADSGIDAYAVSSRGIPHLTALPLRYASSNVITLKLKDLPR
ncbi:MAG: carboxypeptidase-like regulatory domain-containing protein [Prosthecobacter sp.]